MRLVFLSWVLVAACSTSYKPSRSGELGVFTLADASTATPAADGDGLVVPRGEVSVGDNALTARIATPAGLALEIVTVACAGECADVVAEARGGNPPYRIEWEDGSTDAARRVCPQQSGELKVEVTDSAITGTEFGYEPHTASARVTSQVLACPDAGAPAADGGANAADGGQEPECKQISVSMSEVEGCQQLQPRFCPSTASVFQGAYDLPFSLQPGKRSCMVVFGDPQILTLADGLNVYIGADGTADKDSCRMAESGEILWNNDGSVPANGDPSVGRALCLNDPSIAYNKVMISARGLDGDESVPANLDLRICEHCPLAP